MMWTGIGLWLAWSAASAQDALTFEAVRTVIHGEGQPSITFNPAVTGQLEVSLDCGDKPRAGVFSLAPGVPVVFTLTGLPEGSHHCDGTLSLAASDGTTGDMTLSLDVASLPRLQLSATAASLDLEAHTLDVVVSREVAAAQLRVLGERGVTIAEAEAMATMKPDVIRFQWSQGEAEVVKLEVSATDTLGFKSALTLSPWSYAIPHTDVVFDPNLYAVTEAEAPKLEETWRDIQDVQARYGEVVEIQLYVAGYTDTVGDAASNLQLSRRRARAIATWFRARGFQGHIAYQGFGESVLAVPTADEIDEPANRRAAYILAARQPERSAQLPGVSWTTLP